MTYRGVARLEPLAAGPGAPFYSQYSADGTKLTYTLVTSLDHLPQRLDIELAVELEPASIVRSLYSVTYRSWGEGTRIDAPTLTRR
ncbi:hypothetical protein [Actinomadura sp. 7K507]|uniref:hypothetical protein n=1 Tax=Actinomadura sp. 7K507 TaxID=2530365 RepID=UPI0010514038|nr:hypothetical protein [Actinomadura sp. 7K507]TDC90929.1 hypothetical protein E1285_13925 [Actinomadura sp. 7K507]